MTASEKVSFTSTDARAPRRKASPVMPTPLQAAVIAFPRALDVGGHAEASRNRSRPVCFSRGRSAAAPGSARPSTLPLLSQHEGDNRLVTAGGQELHPV